MYLVGCVLMHITLHKAALSGFETYKRRHQKSKIGVSAAQQEGLMSSKN